jgi:nitrate reductase beta subunit
MRAFYRERQLEGRDNLALIERAGLSVREVEDMHRYLSIANYEDRFVIPTTHREYAENAYQLRGECGFSFGNSCSDGETPASLFGGKMSGKKVIPLKTIAAKSPDNAVDY